MTIGFVKDAKDHVNIQGFNVYHKNRLIKVIHCCTIPHVRPYLILQRTYLQFFAWKLSHSILLRRIFLILHVMSCLNELMQHVLDGR